MSVPDSELQAFVTVLCREIRKRLELRFRLESAVLAAHLDLEAELRSGCSHNSCSPHATLLQAIASMPSSTEAQGFLKDCRVQKHSKRVGVFKSWQNSRHSSKQKAYRRQGLRGFVLDALAAESSAEAAKVRGSACIDTAS